MVGVYAVLATTCMMDIEANGIRAFEDDPRYAVCPPVARLDPHLAVAPGAVTLGPHPALCDGIGSVTTQEPLDHFNIHVQSPTALEASGLTMLQPMSSTTPRTRAGRDAGRFADVSRIVATGGPLSTKK
jgi:hypothetical protein